MKISTLTTDDRFGAEAAREQLAIDVLTGLSSHPKRLPAKYFYDDVGSQLFQQITQHDDYYPTRTEFEILEKVKDLLPQIVDQDRLDVIELGVGDGHKSRLIIDGLLDAGCQVQYFPIDISQKAMQLLEPNTRTHPRLSTHGIVAEYMEGLRFARAQSNNPQLVLFLGSNIGNFDRVQNQGFLRRLWKSLRDGDLTMIGFDLKKDVKLMTAAYNDSSGHTRQFNLNLLSRINAELGADFDPRQFEHFGIYNPVLGAMESYLLPNIGCEVYIQELSRSFHFEPFEPLHLEYSFKFLEADINFLCAQTGFRVVEHFTDARRWFMDSLWRVSK